MEDFSNLLKSWWVLSQDNKQQVVSTQATTELFAWLTTFITINILEYLYGAWINSHIVILMEPNNKSATLPELNITLLPGH